MSVHCLYMQRTSHERLMGTYTHLLPSGRTGRREAPGCTKHLLNLESLRSELDPCSSLHVPSERAQISIWISMATLSFSSHVISSPFLRGNPGL